jgi:hypothetical protein
MMVNYLYSRISSSHMAYYHSLICCKLLSVVYCDVDLYHMGMDDITPGDWKLNFILGALTSNNFSTEKCIQ